MDHRVARAAQVFAVAINLLLLDEGCRMSTGPERPIAFVRGSDSFELFTAIQALAAGTLSGAEWRAVRRTRHRLAAAGQRGRVAAFGNTGGVTFRGAPSPPP